MSFEEEFDKKVKLKLDEAAYPFDESNWEKASLMIDADRKPAAVPFMSKFYLPMAIAGISLLGFLMIYLYGDKSQQNTSLAMAAETKNTANTVNTVTSTNQLPQAPLQETNTKVIPPVNSAANNPEVNETVPAKVQVPSSPQPVNQLPNADRSVSSTKNTASSAPIASMNFELPSLAKTKKTKTLPSNELPVAAKAPPVGISQNQTLGSQEQTPANENQKEQIMQTSATAKDSEPPFSKKETPQNNSLIPLAETTLANSDSKPKENKSPFSTETVQTEQVNPTEEPFEPLPLTSFKDNAYQPEISNSPFVVLPRYDDDYYKKQSKRTMYFVNLEGGLFYNLGWEAGKNWDGRGANAYTGVNVGYHFNKKLAASIGVQAFNLGHTNEPFYTGNNKQYGFYSINTGTIITAKNVGFVSVPIKLYYSPNKSGQLGLSLTTAYLFGAQNTVRTYTELDLIKTFNPNKAVNGVYDNTRRFNYIVSVFYNYQLNRRLALAAEYMYGLTDIYKNTPNINYNEKLQGIKLGLVFTLINK